MVRCGMRYQKCLLKYVYCIWPQSKKKIKMSKYFCLIFKLCYHRNEGFALSNAVTAVVNLCALPSKVSTHACTSQYKEMWLPLFLSFFLIIFPFIIIFIKRKFKTVVAVSWDQSLKWASYYEFKLILQINQVKWKIDNARIYCSNMREDNRRH